MRLCLHDRRVEICGVFTRAGGLESSVKISTSRFPTICIYFLGKYSAKYTKSLLKADWTGSLHFSAISNTGWNLNPACRPWFRFNPGCYVNSRFILCASRVEIHQINKAWVLGWLTKQCSRTYDDTGGRSLWKSFIWCSCLLAQGEWNPLHVASQNEDETVVKLLLAAGSDVNKAAEVSYISWWLVCTLV